jgi:hypothetical protein
MGSRTDSGSADAKNGKPTKQEVLEAIAELTVCPHIGFRDRISSLQLSTKILGNAWLIRQLETRFHSSIDVPNRWKTTVGAVVHCLCSE